MNDFVYRMNINVEYTWLCNAEFCMDLAVMHEISV